MFVSSCTSNNMKLIIGKWRGTFKSCDIITDIRNGNVFYERVYMPDGTVSFGRYDKPAQISYPIGRGVYKIEGDVLFEGETKYYIKLLPEDDLELERHIGNCVEIVSLRRDKGFSY